MRSDNTKTQNRIDMIKILANDGIHPDGQMLLEEAGYQVITEKIPQEELAAKLPEYDAIIVRSATKVRKELIDQCPKLKVIARAGVGLDNIDHAYAREKGLQVINTPAASSKSVAELVFGHVYTLARFLQQANFDMRNLGEGDFKKLKKAYSKGFELRGKTLGVIGFGRIGQETARIGLGVGMRVLAADIQHVNTSLNLGLYSSDEIDVAVKMETTDMETVLREADVISLHVPSAKEPIIGTEQFAKMKDGSIIVNASRGGIIDEEALLEALESGKLWGAGLDVFENEPMPRQEILKHPKVSVSPHIGGSTQEAQSNIGLELADKILAYFGH